MMTVPNQRSMTGCFTNGDNEQGPKEELAKTENKKCKRKEGQVSAAAFPSRMSKKRRIDVVKSHLPETPEKKY